MNNGEIPQWWVAGLGGVGGYIGGKLCKWAMEKHSMDLHFLARGSHCEAILKQGLELRDQGVATVVHPKSCVGTVTHEPPASFIFICCKSYDLGAMLEQIAPLVDSDTCLLPLLNGVAAVEMVQERFPQARVLDGGAFMVSSITAPGVITNQGPKQQLFIGSRSADDDVLTIPVQIMEAAGIDVMVHHPIQLLTWEKFIFIAPLATMTTVHNVSARHIGLDPMLRQQFKALFLEMVSLANTLGLHFTTDLWEITLNKVLNTPEGATTSMHRDFMNKKGKCEVAFLTEYPVRTGTKMGTPMPGFADCLRELKSMGAFPLL